MCGVLTDLLGPFHAAAAGVLAVALWLGVPTRLAAATASEQRAFTNALKPFRGEVWSVADKDLGAFVEKYPKSEFLPEAILLQGQARVQARRPAEAIPLLSAAQAQAGPLADEYCFWLGQAQLAASNHTAAAGEFARLASQFPTSPRVGEAAGGEAMSRSRLGEWAAVVALLGPEDGAFRNWARTNASHPGAIDGFLLLAEARAREHQPAAVLSTLASLTNAALPPRAAWRRDFLQARALQDTGNLPGALASASNVLASAASAGMTELVVFGRDLTADLLAESARAAEAIPLLEANMATNLPAATRRSAMAKLVRLLMETGQVEIAGTRLDEFLKANPQDAGWPSFLLTMGELRLRRYLTINASTNRPDTNRLVGAAQLFEAALTNAPPDWPDRGRAVLLRGWSLWLDGRLPEARAAFGAAAEALPVGMPQAVACFKLADTALALGDAATALTNYQRVLTGYDSLPLVQRRLREPALYQLLRAAMLLNDHDTARQALNQILSLPNGQSDAVGGGLLLLGENELDAGSPQQARMCFGDFARKFPVSPLRADAELGLARALELEGRWDQALAVYAAWITNWPSSPSLPRAEYSLALATARAGAETNALLLFTNFVARFETNELAPFAQNWIADFYFGRGDFKSAEEAYQLLYQKWPNTDLAGEARMMAGRAAAARLQMGAAQGYFAAAVNASNSPPDLIARALFALADAAARSENTDTNKPLANYAEAITAFRKLAQLFPTNALAILAEGRVGDCYLQMAGSSTNNYYALANEAYSNVLNSARADVAARSQAEVGLGLVLDKQARALPAAEAETNRVAALERFLNVAYQRNLRQGEQADAFWVKFAALEAAKLLEDTQQWPAAARLYEQLGRLIPSLKPGLDAKLKQARAQSAQ